MKRVKIFHGYTYKLESEINEFLDEGNIIESLTQINYEKDILIITIIYTVPKPITLPPKFENGAN